MDQQNNIREIEEIKKRTSDDILMLIHKIHAVSEKYRQDNDHEKAMEIKNDIIRLINNN